MAAPDDHAWHQFIGDRNALLLPDEYPTAMRHKIVRAQLWRLLVEHPAIENALGRSLSVAPWETTAQLASALALREDVSGDPEVAELVATAEATFGSTHQRWLRRVLKILAEALKPIEVHCQPGCCPGRLELHRSVPVLADLSTTAHNVFMSEFARWFEEGQLQGLPGRTVPPEEIGDALVWTADAPAKPPLTVTVLPGENLRAAIARARREDKRRSGVKRAPKDGLYQRDAAWLYRHRVLGEPKSTLAREVAQHGNVERTISRGIRRAEDSLRIYDARILDQISPPDR